MLPFLRSDLAQLAAYKPHPGGLGAEAPAIVDRLDTNESPYDLPAELKQKLAWHYQHSLEANRYPDGSHAELKVAIAQYANESAHTDWVQPTHISIGNGSDELIRALLIATCLGGEDSILVANPTFSMYAITANTLGIPVVTVGRDETTFAIDCTAAQAAIADTDAQPIRVVFVVHPNSPTANALTEAEIEWLRQLPDHILVVIDEAYFEFSQTSLLPELPQHPNWVILRTFSKAYRLASHRVGYGLAHPGVAAALEKVRLPYNLPAMTQTAAQLTLQHRAELLPIIETIRQEREKLGDRLRSFPTLRVWPSDANFFFVRLDPTALAPDLDPDATLDRLFNTLKQQGTLIRKTSGGLRITVGTPEENQRTGDRLQALLPEICASASGR
ncbi:MAG: histidinol-phosphate transaminase [Cyanobacteria bacterium J06638_20]